MASSSSGCKSLSGSEGLNAATGDYEDLVKIGVIDAAKVTRSALQNAASIAALFLTTEAVVADKPEKDAAGACPVEAWRTSESLRVRERPARRAGPLASGPAPRSGRRGGRRRPRFRREAGGDRA